MFWEVLIMQEIFCGKTVEAKNIDTDLLQNLNKELLNFQKYLKPENNDFFSKQYNIISILAASLHYLPANPLFLSS